MGCPDRGRHASAVQCQCSASAVPVQCQCSAMPVPVQCHASAMPVQCQCSASAVPCQCSAMPCQCSASAMPVQCHASASAMQVQCKAVQVQCQCSAMPCGAMPNCRHHDTLFFRPMLDKERISLAVCMGTSVDAVQKQSEELLQLQDTLLEALCPGTAIATPMLPPHAVPGRVLREFSKLARVAVRDYPLLIKAWGVRGLDFRPIVEMEAPGLQRHPLWATFSEKVLYAAGKVQAKVDSCTAFVMDPEHCLVSGVQGVVLPGMEQLLAPVQDMLQEVLQRQRAQGRAEAEGALAHPHASPPSPLLPPPAPDTPDAGQDLMVADETTPLVPEQQLSLAFPIEYYTMQEAWQRLVELQQVRCEPLLTATLAWGNASPVWALHL